MNDIHSLANLGVYLLDSEDGGILVQEVVLSTLGAEIKEKQEMYPILIKVKNDVGVQKVMVFEISRMVLYGTKGGCVFLTSMGCEKGPWFRCMNHDMLFIPV